MCVGSAREREKLLTTTHEFCGGIYAISNNN